MKLNDGRVLKAVERGIKEIPADVLYHFRYSLAGCKISRRDINNIPASLPNFIASIGKPNIQFYPVGEKQISLHSTAIYVDSSSKRRCKLKVYIPKKSGKSFTVQVRKFEPLKIFKNELVFVQNGGFVTFDELDSSRDIIAISKKKIDNNNIVIHYVP